MSFGNNSNHVQSKKILFGYIRRIQTILTSQLGNNAMYIIPDLVTILCLSYYGQREYFAVNGKDVESSTDYLTIHRKIHWKNEGIDNISYGAEVIESKSNRICLWNIQFIGNIIDTDYEAYEDYDYELFVGITSNSLFSQKRKSINYCFRTCGKKKAKNGKWEKYTESSINFGAIIGIKLDLKNKTISFYHNDKNIGIAFENIECGYNINYRLAVSIFYEESPNWLVYESENDDSVNEENEDSNDNGIVGCKLIDFVEFSH
eukprot:332803_1